MCAPAVCSQFQFCPQIPRKLENLARNFVIVDDNFPTKRKFFDKLKFKGGGQLPPCHDATGSLCGTDGQYAYCDLLYTSLFIKNLTDNQHMING